MKGNSMQIKNVIVTGGGGFLGKAIVKKLLKKNHNVTSFSRKFYPELEKMGVKQIQGDIADKAVVIKTFENIDTVFHVAAKAGMWGPFEEFFQANVRGTENVISACLKNDIKQLIYTSSPSVVSDKEEKLNWEYNTEKQAFVSMLPVVPEIKLVSVEDNQSGNKKEVTITKEKVKPKGKKKK